MGTFTPKQRDTLLKITINASNAVLGGLVLGSIISPGFRVKTFLVGLALYVTLVMLAVFIDR